MSGKIYKKDCENCKHNGLNFIGAEYLSFEDLAEEPINTGE